MIHPASLDDGGRPRRQDCFARAGRFRLSLKLKLGVMTTALVVITVFVVAAFLLRQEQRSLTAQITKRGLIIATHLAASAKSPMLTDDDLTLNLLVRDAVRDPEVVYVMMVDERPAQPRAGGAATQRTGRAPQEALKRGRTSGAMSLSG